MRCRLRQEKGWDLRRQTWQSWGTWRHVHNNFYTYDSSLVIQTCALVPCSKANDRFLYCCFCWSDSNCLNHLHTKMMMTMTQHSNVMKNPNCSKSQASLLPSSAVFVIQTNYRGMFLLREWHTETLYHCLSGWYLTVDMFHTTTCSAVLELFLVDRKFVSVWIPHKCFLLCPNILHPGISQPRLSSSFCESLCMWRDVYNSIMWENIEINC